MAITKIHPITTTLSKALDYIQAPDKTDEKLLISGYACTPSVAVFQFNQIKEKADKKNGSLAQHLIQSFAPGEVDFETAHSIGIELADRILKGRFQYVIATHIDKGHIHNHLIWNSVSFKDHKKYHSTPNSYYYIQRTSDIICKDNGLSIIDKPKERGKSHYEHLLDKRGQSWKSKLRQTIDLCILKARNWDEFLILMDKEKYEIKHGKHISFRAEGKERFTRSKTLGEKYTEDNIRKRIAGEAVQNGAANSDIGRNLIIDIENNIKVKQSVLG
ncbi:relaxase/mobilization nuclease domain-containing protein [Ruminococcus sp.]|uniref:relaxase/mobilization nuclease domain-containing protein n=1 Tax=Ruminococcus sp. TaxID=41978 RepID=UPI0025DDC812|nr:relaxase/mobilization nuclease domain-containing protein [Ruminococcus sp.]